MTLSDCDAGENSRLSKEYIVDVKRISERCPTQADVKGLDLTEIWMRQDSKERSNLLRNKHPVRMSSSEEALILKNEFFFQSDDRDGADLKGEQAYERLVLEKLRHGLVIGGAALKPALVEVMDGECTHMRVRIHALLLPLFSSFPDVSLLHTHTPSHDLCMSAYRQILSTNCIQERTSGKAYILETFLSTRSLPFRRRFCSRHVT